MERNRNKRSNIMGLAIDAIELDEATELVATFAKSSPPHFVCVNSLQDVVISKNDPNFREIVNQADLATADGWPVVWSLRAAGAVQKGRVTGPDLMLEVCREGVDEGLKHYFYGGAEGVPELLAQCLQEKYPGLEVSGCYSPPFRELTDEEDAAIVDMINDSGADVLWIGISTPKQHFWVQNHISRLKVGVILTVGAAFDFHSGRVKRAPLWMRDNAMEWLYRMFQEPKRLGPRYVKYVPQFAILSLAHKLGLRQFSIDGSKSVYGPSDANNS